MRLRALEQVEGAVCDLSSFVLAKKELQVVAAICSVCYDLQEAEVVEHDAKVWILMTRMVLVVLEEERVCSLLKMVVLEPLEVPPKGELADVHSAAEVLEARTLISLEVFVVPVVQLGEVNVDFVHL